MLLQSSELPEYYYSIFFSLKQNTILVDSMHCLLMEFQTTSRDLIHYVYTHIHTHTHIYIYTNIHIYN